MIDELGQMASYNLLGSGAMLTIRLATIFGKFARDCQFTRVHSVVCSKNSVSY